MSIPNQTLHRSSSRIHGPIEHLNILSFDGGGVRGLSSLIMLQQVFGGIRDSLNRPTMRPCEYFHLIGGTSTGGIIAIMLGRLRMTIEECIETYERIGEEVFRKPRWPVGLHTSKFSHEPLEDVLKQTITKALRKHPEQHALTDKELAHVTLFDPQISAGKDCCTVVFASTPNNFSDAKIFRSYHLSESQNPAEKQIKIWQAARATSAAPGTFDPLKIGSGRNEIKYVDGGLGNNNPCDLLIREAGNIWYDLHGTDMKRYEDIGLLLSFGTGVKPISRLDQDALVHRIAARFQQPTAYIDVMRFMITNSETFHRSIYEQGLKSYFRFNVSQGVGDVELFEYKAIGNIKVDTATYLDHQDTKKLRRRCWERAVEIAAPQSSSERILQTSQQPRARSSTSSLFAPTRQRGMSSPDRQSPTQSPARSLSARTAPGAPRQTSHLPSNLSRTFSNASSSSTPNIFVPLTVSTSTSSLPWSPSMPSMHSTSAPMASPISAQAQLSISDRGFDYQTRYSEVAVTPSMSFAGGVRQMHSTRVPQINLFPTEELQLPSARPRSAFLDLTDTALHLCAPLTTDTYWSRMTPFAFAIYEKVYTELPKTGSGHASLQGMIQHFAFSPALQSQMHAFWRLLDLQSRALAPRPYILILIYMLHSDQYSEARPQSRKRSAAISTERFGIIQRAGNWVDCRCKPGCGGRWTFPGNVQLGLYKVPAPSGCRAVEFYWRAVVGAAERSDPMHAVFVRMNEDWMATTAHYEIPM